jgi:hypothetical protein
MSNNNNACADIKCNEVIGRVAAILHRALKDDGEKKFVFDLGTVDGVRKIVGIGVYSFCEWVRRAIKDTLQVEQLSSAFERLADALGVTAYVARDVIVEEVNIPLTEEEAEVAMRYSVLWIAAVIIGLKYLDELPGGDDNDKVSQGTETGVSGEEAV